MKNSINDVIVQFAVLWGQTIGSASNENERKIAEEMKQYDSEELLGVLSRWAAEYNMSVEDDTVEFFDKKLTDEMSEKNTVVVQGKEIDLTIDTKEYPCFQLALVADEYAFYHNPGDDILVVDLKTKEILDEDDGLKRYHDTMTAIVNEEKPYEFGDSFIHFYGKYFIQPEELSMTELDKKIQIADVVKRNADRQKVERTPVQTMQHETVKTEGFGIE